MSSTLPSMSFPPLHPPGRYARRLSLALTLGATGWSAAQTANFSLADALAQLEGSPSVTQAALSVQVAQTNLDAARTALGLTVSVNGSAAYTGGTSTTDSSTSGSAGVNVSLGLLPWSSNQASLRSAQRSLTLAQARLTSAQNSARLNVVQQYLNAVNATQSVTLAGQTLALRERQLVIVQTQQQSGNATAESALSAQANVQAAQAAQVQAQASLESARRNLSAALGREISGVNFDTQPSAEINLPDVEALTKAARSQTVDVVDARNSLEAARENLATLQREAVLPDLTASLRYGPASSGGLNASLNLKQGTAGAGYSLPLNADSTASASASRLSASVSASYVVYSPTQKAQVAAAQANVTQAELTLNVAQQNAELDVRSKYAALQSALITVQTRATQVQVAELARQTAQTRLQAGTGTQDDVREAELNLAQAQLDLQTARTTAQINLLQLQNAAGGPL